MTGNQTSSGNLRSENPFARLFAQKSVSNEVATAGTSNAAIEAGSVSQQGTNEKRGRFNLVPATVVSTATETADGPGLIPASCDLDTSDHASPHAVVPVNVPLATAESAHLDSKLTVLDEKSDERRSMMENVDEVSLLKR